MCLLKENKMNKESSSDDIFQAKAYLLGYPCSS